MPKQIKVDIKLPNSSELEKQLSSLISKLKDNKIDLGLDTKAFNGSLKEMTNALDNLKGKLKDFNVLENATKDSTKVKSDIQAVTSEIGNLVKETKKFDSMGNLVNSTKTLKDSFAQTTKLMSDESKTIIQDFEKLDNKIADMQNKLSKSSDNSLINPSVIDNLQNKLNSINTNTSEKKIKELQATINNLASSDSSIIRLQNAISNLQNNLKNTRSKYGSLVDLNDLKNTTAQVNNLKSVLSDVMSGKSISSSKITSEISKANNSFKTLTTNARTSGNALRTASQDATSFGTAIQRAFGNIGIFLSTTTAIRTVTTELRNASNYIVELDERLTNIQMITGKSSSSVQNITNDFKNLGSQLHTTNSELMAGAEEVLRAGYDVDTAEKMMEASIMGAKLSGQTTEQVTQQLIAIKNAFNLDGSAMNNVVDIISKMDDTSATSFAEIADAIQRTAYSAQQAGTPLENLVAYITTVSEKTRRSADTIGESFKSIYSRYFNIKLGNMDDEGKSINDVEKALAKVDIKLRDSADSFREFDDVLEEYVKKYQSGTVSQVEHLAVVNTLAGTRQKETLLALIENFDAVKRHQDDMIESAGSAKKKFDEVYSDSLKAKLSDLQRSFEGLYESFLNSSTLGTSIDVFSSMIDGISKVTNTFGALPTTITTVVSALTIFNSKFRESVSTMTSFTPIVGGLQSKLKIFEQDLIKQATALKSQISNIKAYNDSTKQMGPPIANAGKNLLGLNAKLALTTSGLVATKVATIALNTAMSMALTMGISAIISGLGSLIDKIVLTRSELNELNQEFITTNSETDTSKVIDLVNTYEELQNTLSTLSKGTAEYKSVEDKLAVTQESIISVYPDASKAIEYNTEAKRLNLEATKKLIDKDLELAKSDALNILKENDTKTDSGLDGAIEKYQEYYKVLEQVNKLAEDEVEGSVNIESKLSDSGELLVSAKDVEVYKKRVESLNDTLEASYEAYKILGVSNDKYAEKAKKVGEVLGYSASQTEDLINKLKETDDSADETAKALEDINGDGIIDATDQMLQLAETTDKAKTAVQNLGDAFSQLEGPIGILETAIEEFREYGMVSDDTWSNIITSGNSELIALLGDNENFLKNAEQLYGNLKTQQEELAQQTIRRAQEDVNASNQVIDATNAEISAVENLANAKENISSNSIQKRANMESILASNNANSYAIDESNYINKENSKMRSSFDIANERMRAEKEVVDNNSQNYNADDKNYVSLANSKITSSDSVNNAMIDGTRQMVNSNNSNYSVDAKNYANYINSKIASFRAFAKAQNQGLNLGTLGFKKESEMVIKEFENYKNQVDSIANSISNTVSSYVGSGGVGGGVSHGNIGSGSSGNKGSSGSSSSSKEVEDMESLVDRYHDLEDAINDVNNELETNKILQDGATGQQKIKLMEKEIQLYKKQQQSIKNLIAEQKKEAQELKNSLSSQGVSFNSAGDISNYNQILTSKVNWANSLSGDAKEKAIEQVKELEEAMKSYDELVNKTIPSQEQEWESLNNTIKDVYKTQAELIADMEKNISETIEYELKKRYDAKKEALNKEKELYNKEYEEANFEEEMNTERNKLAEIQAEIDKVKNDTSRAGQLRLKQLLEEYEDQQKVINDKIKEQQNQAINDRFDEEEALLDKELEDMTSTENLSQMVAEAISTGMIKIGEETINVQNSMNDMLKETEVGFANVALQQSEWLSNLEQIKTLYSSINSIMSNAGMTIPSYNNISRSRSIGDISITTGGITITGNADNSTLGNIKDMLDAQAKEIYKNIAKQLS